MFDKSKKGTVSSLIEKQQKEDLRRFKKEKEYEEKRKQKLRKLKEQREEAKARGTRKHKPALFGIKVKKKAQTSKLSRKRRIRLI